MGVLQCVDSSVRATQKNPASVDVMWLDTAAVVVVCETTLANGAKVAVCLPLCVCASKRLFVNTHTQTLNARPAQEPAGRGSYRGRSVRE